MEWLLKPNTPRLGLGLEVSPSSSTLRHIGDLCNLGCFPTFKKHDLYVCLKGYVLWPMGVFVRALAFIFILLSIILWYTSLICDQEKIVIDSNTRGSSCGANSLVALSRFIFMSRTFPMADAYADVASKTTLHHGRTWLMMRKRRINPYMTVPLGK